MEKCTCRRRRKHLKQTHTLFVEENCRPSRHRKQHAPRHPMTHTKIIFKSVYRLQHLPPHTRLGQICLHVITGDTTFKCFPANERCVATKVGKLDGVNLNYSAFQKHGTCLLRSFTRSMVLLACFWEPCSKSILGIYRALYTSTKTAKEGHKHKHAGSLSARVQLPIFNRL